MSVQKPSDRPAVDPREMFAAERTLLAWVRTGLALMGFGFALARFGMFLRIMGQAKTSAHTPHFSVSIGIMLVAMGVLTNILAAYHHLRFVSAIRRGESTVPNKMSPAVILAVTLSILGVAGCLYLLTL